ncbi:hypothetical protein D3C81_1643980 [compost metagenome]
MAVDPENKQDILSGHHIDTIPIVGREYISINHQGSAMECTKFFAYLITHVMPGLRHEVKGSVEMEIIQTKARSLDSKMRQIDVDYTYLISID